MLLMINRLHAVHLIVVDNYLPMQAHTIGIKVMKEVFKRKRMQSTFVNALKK